MNRLPDFLIIGAQKSGTSWLHRELAAHPQLFLPTEKELRFFKTDVAGSEATPEELKLYSSHFTDAPEYSLIGEATPIYLFDPKVPSRIHSAIPDVKLIAMLRDPADRAYSHWRMTTSIGRISADIPFLASFYDDMPKAASMKARGLYSEQLKRYYDYFPAENIKVFTYDEMVSNSSKLLTDVYSFLGVETSFRSERHEERHKTRYADYKEVPSKISEKDRLNLVNFYKKSIEELEEMLGRELSHWKQV